MAATASARPGPTRSTSGRRLLSKIALPFSPRTRTLAEYYIRPQEPHRSYSPGDVVKGAVVLTVVKPIRITHLVVYLRGYVRVLKKPSSSDATNNDEALWNPGRPKQSGDHFGNGFASLFRDEVVLCGEGRLDAGIYEFNFELEFPGKGLPSSIDFERGTISYMITSTLTRPTTISPTSTCDRKVQLVETVDVGPLQHPKSRKITLEPILRRKKSKSRMLQRHERAAATQPNRSRNEIPRVATPDGLDSTSVRSSEDQREPPQSPAGSEFSSASVASTSTGSARAGSNSSVAWSCNRMAARDGSITSIADKTITSTVELLRSGCLPGDVLPLTVHINHTKPIKSLHGIIITFYRQGRIDMHPALPPTRNLGGKRSEKSKHEDYYPKSKTGLGGLSLSSAGSSSLFRKDLAQTVAPIMVDPQTLSAEIKASIRVPEDVFPTIASVPGAIISFKYFVEVVVDLNGKLAGPDNAFPRHGTIATAPSHATSTNVPMSRTEQGMENMLAALGGSIVDTDQIRRDKSVVACLFEVVVGTTDSSKNRSKWTKRQWQAERENAPQFDEVSRIAEQARAVQLESSVDPTSRPSRLRNEFETAPAFSTVPPPEDITHDPGDEKAMLRQVEERLLPSAPDSYRPAGNVREPSAPNMPEIHEEHDVASDWTDENREMPSAPPMELVGPSSEHTVAPSSSRQDEALPSANWSPPMSEDKQELERCRLEMEASAPDDAPFTDDEDGGHDAARGDEAHIPSAPVLPAEEDFDNEDILGVGDDSNTEQVGESLPRYER